VLTGRNEWRLAYPTPMCREIEDAVHARMRRGEAHMRQETALRSPQTDGAKEPEETRPTCPHGETAWQPRGKRKRDVQRSEEETARFARTSRTYLHGGMGLFPLMSHGNSRPAAWRLTRRNSWCILATWMPFAHAADRPDMLVRVQVREATIQRQTAQAGTVCEGLHQEPGQPCGFCNARQRMLCIDSRSALTARVSLGGVWANARDQRRNGGGEQATTTTRSSVSI
jgi:hypothetical protein